jgi:hypothetical protein
MYPCLRQEFFRKQQLTAQSAAMNLSCFSCFRPSLGEEPENSSRLKDAKASMKLLQDENAALQEEVKRVHIQVQ